MNCHVVCRNCYLGVLAVLKLFSVEVDSRCLTALKLLVDTVYLVTYGVVGIVGILTAELYCFALLVIYTDICRGDNEGLLRGHYLQASECFDGISERVGADSIEML